MLIFNRTLLTFCCLWISCLFISMAGLEISSWAAVLIFLIGFIVLRKQQDSLNLRSLRLLNWPLLGLLIATFASYLVNAKDGASFVTIIGYSRWVVTLFVFTSIFIYLRVSKRILIPYFVSLAIACIYGWLTVYTGWDFIRHRWAPAVDDGFRAISFLGFPMTWGHTCALALCMTYALYIRALHKKQSIQWWLLACLVLVGSNLMMTLTRGAWLAGIAGICVIAFFTSLRTFIVTVASIFLIFFASYSLSSVFEARTSTMADVEASQSNSERLQIWQTNWMMFTENPWFGVGLNRNELIMRDYLVEKNNPNGFVGHAHNTMLQFLVGTGIFGFGFYVAFILLMAYLTYRAWRGTPDDETWHKAILLGSLGAQVALQVGGLTECNFKAMTVNHHVMFILSLSLAVCYMRSQRPFASK